MAFTGDKVARVYRMAAATVTAPSCEKFRRDVRYGLGPHRRGGLSCHWASSSRTPMARCSSAAGRDRTVGSFPRAASPGESPDEAMFRELRKKSACVPRRTAARSLETGCTTAAGTVHPPARPPALYRSEATLVSAAPDRQREQLVLDTTPEPEFDRWRWVEWWQPVREVIYFKRGVYVRALRELAPLLFPSGQPPRPPWWQKDWDEVADG